MSRVGLSHRFLAGTDLSICRNANFDVLGLLYQCADCNHYDAEVLGAAPSLMPRCAREVDLNLSHLEWGWISLCHPSNYPCSKSRTFFYNTHLHQISSQ
jgi:hypothetical protein